MTTKFFLLLILPALASAASVVQCPQGGFCENYLEETSFDFLDKLSLKQRQSVISLNMSGASLDKLSPKLKYLKKLVYLDLSNNNVLVHSLPPLPSLKVLKLSRNYLKDVRFEKLPRNLEEVDLSDNLLTHVPKDWKYLGNLKRLLLNKNPMSCECHNVLRFREMLKTVVVSEDIICSSPKNVKGKNMSSINCSFEDIMLNDVEVEGSGNGDIVTSESSSNIYDVPQLEEHEKDQSEPDSVIIGEGYIPQESSSLDVNKSVIEQNEEEGSGDEGSGFGDIIDPNIVCHINCSTPPPLENNDLDRAPPHFVDQAKILLEDFKVIPTEATTTTTTTQQAATPTPVVEVFHEIINNNTQKTELEMASMVPEPEGSSMTVYIVVGVCILLGVIFILLFVKKRGNRATMKQNRLEANDNYGEEMKPMNKPTVDAINEKTSPPPESIPLINGNGKAAHEEPFLRVPTPEKMYESTPEDLPEIRHKNPDLLTPQRERVTIRASEIPDSLPKTPVLVHRQKNSDGNIITTPVVS